MANTRNNTFILKVSNVAGKVPQISNLMLGEVAVNVADAKMYSLFTGGASAATSVQQIGWDRLSLTGGTVSGNVYANLFSATTIQTPALTANTISSVNNIDFNTASTVSALAGRLFFNNSSDSLTYYPQTTNTDVSVNLGQVSLIRVFNQSGNQINKGQVVHITGATVNTPTLRLANASYALSGLSTEYGQASGIATHDIPNNSFGFITNFGLLTGINTSGFTAGDELFISDTVDGGISNNYNNLAYKSRVSFIGWCISSDTSNGSIIVLIQNELPTSSITIKEGNIINGNNTSTGVFVFSGITSASTTTVNINPVQGWIVDNTSNPVLPTLTYVNYSGVTGLIPQYLSGSESNYFFITSASTLFQTSTFPTPIQRRQNIYLGKTANFNNSIIAVLNQTDNDISPISQLRDMFTPIKLINDGITINSYTGLTTALGAGNLWGLGINFYKNALNPSQVSLAGSSPLTFQYRNQTGGTVGSNTTLIDPTNYDLNGIITPVGSPTKQATNQRIYIFPTGLVRIQYGQTVYSTLSAAIAAASTETFIVYPNARDNGLLIAILSVQAGASDLTNSSQAQFSIASKFGESVSAGAGASTTTLQQAYNNSAPPQITTNSTFGSVEIKRGSASDTDDVFTLLNGAGVRTAAILGNGTGLFTNLQVTGLTSSANTRYIVSDTNGNFSYTTLNAATGGTYSNGTITLSGSGVLGTITGFSTTTASTYNPSTGVLTNSKSDGTSYTAGTWNYISATTLNSNILSITSNGGSVVTTTINAATGGTYSNGTITLSGTGTLSNITGLISANTFTTASTYNAGTGILTHIRNDGQTYTAGTWNYISATTLSGNVLSITSNGGSVVNSTINAITGGSYGGTVLTLSGTGTFTTTIGGFPASLKYYAEYSGNPAVSPSATGARSIALGDNAVASASDMFVYGQYGGTSATGATFSNFLGQYAGSGAINAFYSNFLGTVAGGSAASANNSNFFGNHAGYQAYSANNSNFFGQFAGNAGYSASYSNFLGYYAGWSSSNSSYSNFIGYQAGYNSTNANNSNFFGNNAGFQATSASYSNFFGNNAGFQATSASYSNFFGNNTGYGATGATYSNFLNYYAGYQATNASYSNFLGYGAGTSAINAFYSNFLGTNAGGFAYSANNSNFIGTNAGYVAYSASNSNFIGTNAGGFAYSANNSNFIGTNAGSGATIASASTFIGISAGYNATAATSANFFGQNAGNTAYAANNSNFLGQSAGINAYSANNSNFLGTNAGNGASLASNSNFLGQSAGQSAAYANNSNFLGYLAGINAYSANNSNFLGYYAGNGANAANNSNFLGYYAGQAAPNAPYSNFFGYYAGNQATNASYSNFLGQNAGYQANVAYQSNFFGYYAGYNATGASFSNFIGSSAGQTASGANNSNFLGQNAGLNAYNALQSNFFGYNVGNSATNASYSNFLGSQAGRLATNANNSNFLGTNSGYGANGANNSIFIGANAGYTATGASNTNLLGQYAGYNATNASYSNFFGYYAGYSATGASNTNFIGYQAGNNAINASYSNFIGYNVANNSTNIGSNNTIIGTNISLPSGTTNSFNIGGVLFGNNTYSVTTGIPSIVAQTSGQVGINVVSSAITNTLHVVAITNPVRFQGIQAAQTMQFITQDSTGVLYYRSDVLTGTQSTSAVTLVNNVLSVALNGSSTTATTINAATGGTYSAGTITLSGSGVLSSITGLISANTFTTASTYNANTGTLSFARNDGITYTAGTWNYVSATTLNNNILSITSNGGSIINSTINAATGGTYSNGTITLSGSGALSNITGLISANTFTTGSTYNAGTGILTSIRNDGQTYTAGTWNYISAATLNSNILSITPNGGNTTTITINAATGGTYSAGTITLAGSGTLTSITGFPTSFATVYTTGFTYNNNTFTLTNNTGGTLNASINTVTGLTVNGNLTVTGNTVLQATSASTINTASITANTGLFSGAAQNVLTVIGSGTTNPIFSVIGSTGTLFSVSDNLGSGTIFNVNNISGLPIFQVNASSQVFMGNYQSLSLNSTAKVNVTASSGTTIYSIPISAYTGVFFDYTVLSTSGARSGTIMSIFSGTTAQYTDNSTNDIGSTSAITFGVSVVSGNAVLSASAATGTWTVKTIVRAI
jgi:hypothetical protein